MRRHRVQNKYTINFDKKIQEAMPRALSVGLAPASSPKGGALGMSVSFRLDEQSTMSRKR
mgnify:CR=1 FL=1